MEQLNALFKFAASFFKRDWTLNDYPIKVFERDLTSSSFGEQQKPFNWTAQIINWWHMRGDGYSREEALQNLEQAFAAFKFKNKLPRPGRGKRIKVVYAPDDLIEKHRATATDFVIHVLGLDPHFTWLSNESKLSDIRGGEPIETYSQRIRNRYKIEVPDLNSVTIADICARIDEKHGA